MWPIAQFLLAFPFIGSQFKEANIATYDYVIVDGGTAGLTLAARLSESQKHSVVVLEAGNDHSNNTSVLSPRLAVAQLGNSGYDWMYVTTPQVHSNSRSIAQPRGKQLGGSSVLNLLYWTHASRQDLDSWGELGNEGWEWDTISPYFSKSEAFQPPSAKVTSDLKAQYLDPADHGQEGPIQNTLPELYGPFDEVWPRTYEKLGMSMDANPRDGLGLGEYENLVTLDLKTKTRSYAATGYWVPNKQRKNLKVVTGAIAEKIIFKKGEKSALPIAFAVKYSMGGETKMVRARKEVVLSAGVFGSPQILELSGIGDPSLLNEMSIDIVAANPNVGENLQHHAYIPLGYEVIPESPHSITLPTPSILARHSHNISPTAPAHSQLAPRAPPSSHVPK